MVGRPGARVPCCKTTKKRLVSDPESTRTNNQTFEKQRETQHPKGDAAVSFVDANNVSTSLCRCFGSGETSSYLVDVDGRRSMPVAPPSVLGDAFLVSCTRGWRSRLHSLRCGTSSEASASLIDAVVSVERHGVAVEVDLLVERPGFRLRGPFCSHFFAQLNIAKAMLSSKDTHSTTQHNTAQHSTAPHRTTQHTAQPHTPHHTTPHTLYNKTPHNTTQHTHILSSYFCCVLMIHDKLLIASGYESGEDASSSN